MEKQRWGSIVMGRRKFRSQISDNEDESEKRNKMQVREKVQKSKNSVFFRWRRGFEKSARYSGGCGATWPHERWKLGARAEVRKLAGWGKVVSVKGEQQGEVGMQPRSHTVFWSCCKSQTVASHKPCQSVDVEEIVDQNIERN